MTPKIFRSTDTNAPPVSGGAQSLVDLLRACLVNGYGSAFASGTVTSSGVNVSDGDTVTIGTVTYRFKNTMAAINDVKIGASAAATLGSLQNAVNQVGAAGTDFFAGTVNNPDVWASALTTTVLTLKARKGGTAGNSLALSNVAATLTVSGANFTGGSGSDTKTPVGWTEEYSATGKAAFRMPSVSAGVPPTRYYLDVDDSGSVATALTKEVKVHGYETMTAVGTGTGKFNTTDTQNSWRKSSTLDTTARPWMVIADETTLYVFIQTGDTATVYQCGHFGEFYSYIPGDLYKAVIQARAQQATSGSMTQLSSFSSSGAVPVTIASHFTARPYTGIGFGGIVGKYLNWPHIVSSGGSPGTVSIGNLNAPFPNQADGAVLLSPIYLWDCPAGLTFSTSAALRGQFRGIFATLHASGGFADGDTVNGSGDYAGRTFMVVKAVDGSGLAILIETTAWPRST